MMLKDVWKCVTITSGGKFVIALGVIIMLK